MGENQSLLAYRCVLPFKIPAVSSYLLCLISDSSAVIKGEKKKRAHNQLFLPFSVPYIALACSQIFSFWPLDSTFLFSRWNISV